MSAFDQKNSFRREQQAPAFDAAKLTESSYVGIAEKVIISHRDRKDRNAISTSQIRILLDLLNGLREQLRTERVKALTENMIGQVQYIKLRIVYAAGRDNESKGVRDFIDSSGLIKCLDTVGDSVERYELVCKYMEALVAYHRYHINK